MPTLAEQQKRYEVLWGEYYPLFGAEIFQDDPIPMYNIGVSLPLELYEEMENLSKNLQKTTNAIGRWIMPNRLHITLDIPGRIGKHFHKDDILVMQEWLVDICAKTNPFTVQLGNLNCFPNVLYREVYDTNGELYALHRKTANAIPWSEQPQFQGSNFTPHMSLLYLKQKGKNLLPEGFDRLMHRTELLISRIYFQISTDTKDTPIALIEFGSGKLL